MNRVLTIDTYLAGLPAYQRQALAELREMITSAFPDVEGVTATFGRAGAANR